MPYKSNPLAVTDLLGGQIDMMITDTATGVPQIKGGKLRALGVSTPSARRSLPDVPTIDEAGVKGYDMGYWFAAYVPAKTPPRGGRAAARAAGRRRRRARRRRRSTRAPAPSVVTTTPEELAKFQAGRVAEVGPRRSRPRASSRSERGAQSKFSSTFIACERSAASAKARAESR